MKTSASISALRSLMFQTRKKLLLVFQLFVAACLVPRLPAATISFSGTELLGRPTDTSVTINVVPQASANVFYEYGTVSGVYSNRTPTNLAVANAPYEVVISGLQPNTRYFYRMQYEAVIDPGNWVVRDQYSFRTQRAPGNTFVFTIIADSHLNNSLGNNTTLYNQACLNVAADNPDFHLDLGDSFFVDASATGGAVTTQSAADQRYLSQRPYMGNFSHSAAVFLSPGNHEQEEGWNFDDTPVSQAILGLTARKKFWPNPIPDNFYSGNADLLASPVIGTDQFREDYYAWTWGDALFIVFDPFQYTMANPYGSAAGEGSDDPATGDRWNWTLGQQQFNWLKSVLENSNAKYKFLFAHHMLGGTENYVRGGAVPAHQFEWGGYEADGTTWGFSTKRPDWGNNPIHQLMISNGVSAFFHAHDHQFVYEKRDGIVYQLVPTPSMSGFGFDLYDNSPYVQPGGNLPNSGHLRVTVGPTNAIVDYVRSVTGGGGNPTNRQVSYTYAILPNEVGGTNYTITATAGTNGSISPAGAVGVPAGNNRSFIIMPNSGYRVADVLVNTTSVGAVTNYTFTNVQTNHTIAASFEEIPPGPVSLDGMVSTVSRANTVGNAVTVTNTTGTGVNRLMLVGVSWNANTVPRTITSVTFTPNGGSTMGLTEVRTQQPGPTAYRYAAIYSLLNPPSGQTGTVTVTFSGSVANGIIAGVANFAGVNQMTPLGTPSGAGTTNTAPGVTLTGLSGDELVFDTVFLGGNPAPALTAGAGQTQRWNTNISNSRGAASTEQATGGSVTMSWTAVSSGPWAIVAVPIKPAVVDTTSPTVTIDQTSGQGDPTSVSPIHFTVVFSETVTNFAGGDVALSGTAGATAAVVTEIAPNNGTTYSVAVSGMTNSGTVIASVVAGMAHDAGNNGNEASTSTDNTVRYDATAPAILTCPTNMTTNAGTNCQAIIPDFTSHVVASDDSGGVTITQSPLAGTLVGLGDTVVTLTASDGAENQATCQATITVVEGYVPDITGQPQSVTNLVGTDAMLIVTATSCSEIGYQWMFGTNALTSETASTLTITNVQTSHAGDYTAVLANNAGYATSMVAVLTVILPVAPTVSAGPEILPNGHFRVEFSGSANVPYTIQSATNVLGVWLPLTNMTADGNGLIEFQDFTMPASPMRFYRAVYP